MILIKRIKFKMAVLEIEGQIRVHDQARERVAFIYFIVKFRGISAILEFHRRFQILKYDRSAFRRSYSASARAFPHLCKVQFCIIA